MSNQPFSIERTFNAPITKVWKALTDHEQMKEWYFDIPDFKPEIGYEFQFLAGEEEGKQYLHLCKVTSVVPGKKLSYTWRYDNYPGNSEVIFELFELGEQTRLKLTHQGLETLEPGHPDFAKENFAAGWTSFLDDSLKDFLEGKMA